MEIMGHMDAILSLGVTSLVDRLLGVPQPSGRSEPVSAPTDCTSRPTSSRLLLLVAC
jgi:hypothetical protein